MTDKKLMDEIRKASNVEYCTVARWVIDKSRAGEYDLGLRSNDNRPIHLKFERDDLVKMAKEILRTLQPSVEDEILASLRKIQTHLSPRE